MSLLWLLIAPLAACGAEPMPQATKNPSLYSGHRAMTDLPAPVVELVAAVTAGDTDAFLALFTEDGVVDDWGRRFTGRASIRHWSDKEFIGAKGMLTPHKVSRSGDTVTVDAGWKSDFYSGDSRFVFVLEGDAIREMRIVEH
jgi:hypothetical protein